MRILFAISPLSFLALAWATVAITRHVRRSTGTPLTEVPGGPFVAAGINPAPLLPNRARPASYTSSQRHDRTYASKNSGALQDPEARVSTRPRRKGKR